MRTLVLKFPDEFDLTDWWTVNPKKVFSLPQTWSANDFNQAANYFSYPLSKPSGSIMQPLFDWLNKQQLSLSPVFSRAGSAGLLRLVERAAGKIPKAYTFANFFNYYQITCPDDQALILLQEASKFLLDDKKDTPGLSLALVYLKSSSAPTDSGMDLCPVLGRRSPPSANYWIDLKLIDFYQQHGSQLRSSFTWPTLRDFERSWGPHPDFVDSIQLTGDNSVLQHEPASPIEAPFGTDEKHGCSVLGVLFSQSALVDGKPEWSQFSTATPTGLIPLAGCRLYPAFTDNSRDLHESIEQALEQDTQPGDVILIEQQLTELPGMVNTEDCQRKMGRIQIHTKQFQNVASYAPVETDPAIFDLIRVATRSRLQVCVIEPAGNGWFDLDLYDALTNGRMGSARTGHTNRWYNADVVDRAIRNHPLIRQYLVAAGSVSTRSNQICLRHDPVNDSGAILVGAASGSAKPQFNFGSRIDVCGPGYRIPTTYPPDDYGSLCKTSAAAAVMAGVVVLLQALAKSVSDTFLTTQQIRAALREQVRVNDQPVIFNGNIITWPQITAIADQLIS